MPGSRRAAARRAPAVSPAEARYLPVAGRGAVTATLTAITLDGLSAAVPHLRLVLQEEGEEVMVYADRSVYAPVIHQLWRGRRVTVTLRVRDHLLHRLTAEHITVYSPDLDG